MSTNSNRDYNSVLGTKNHYPLYPAEYFCLKFLSLSTINDSSKLMVLKVVESKNEHHFQTTRSVADDKLSLKIVYFFSVFCVPIGCHCHPFHLLLPRSLCRLLLFKLLPLPGPLLKISQTVAQTVTQTVAQSVAQAIS